MTLVKPCSGRLHFDNTALKGFKLFIRLVCFGCTGSFETFVSVCDAWLCFLAVSVMPVESERKLLQILFCPK